VFRCAAPPAKTSNTLGVQRTTRQSLAQRLEQLETGVIPQLLQLHTHLIQGIDNFLSSF
jgi:hypothetical protein